MKWPNGLCITFLLPSWLLIISVSGALAISLGNKCGDGPDFLMA